MKNDERWIPTSKQLPEMHDAKILKTIGIMKISDKCIIMIKHNDETVVDNDADYRDGRWHSDFIRFLRAGKSEFEVTAWMPLPEPYQEEEV